MYTTHQAFLRALIQSACNVRGMWHINALVVLLHNPEVKRPSGRARRRRVVFIKIILKEMDVENGP